MNSFSTSELERYARHLSLPEVGIHGQKRLKDSKVLCVGAGGLGTSVLQYLAAAGVGLIGIVEADTVEVSNLQRQILYTTSDIGKLKVDVASERLLLMNPDIEVKTHPVRLNEENAFEIIAQYDLVIDATDNYAARYLINDVCYFLHKPDIFACILRFQGQCTVFDATNGPCYRCLFPTPPAPDSIPSCSEAGVLGALPGLLGTMQAIEAIKLLLQIGTPLIGRVLTVDVLRFHWNELALERNPECLLCVKNTAFANLARPAAVCQAATKSMTIPEISVQEFKKLQDAKTDYFLLDVREPKEYDEYNLNGYLIPLNELPYRFQELNPKQSIIVHCKMGGRASQAVALLLENGFMDVRNLKGGLMSWKSEIHNAS